MPLNRRLKKLRHPSTININTLITNNNETNYWSKFRVEIEILFSKHFILPSHPHKHITIFQDFIIGMRFSRNDQKKILEGSLVLILVLRGFKKPILDISYRGHKK